MKKKNASILLILGLYQNWQGLLYNDRSICRYAGIDTREMQDEKDGVSLCPQSVSERDFIYAAKEQMEALDYINRALHRV